MVSSAEVEEEEEEEEEEVDGDEEEGRSLGRFSRGATFLLSILPYFFD